MKKMMTIIVLYFVNSLVCYGAFQLDGTRYIFPSNQNAISIKIENKDKKVYGGQSWIDTTTGNADMGAFIVSPGFFKIAPHDTQVLRVMKVNGQKFPTDRESISIFNAQEIPPVSDIPNALSLAVNSRVKIIYRPQDLIKKRPDAEKMIKIMKVDKGFEVHNPTPYYFAIIEIKIASTPIKLNEADEAKITTFKPFSVARINPEKLPDVFDNIEVEAIDDYGAHRIYKIK